jgi:hypothetical protein
VTDHGQHKVKGPRRNNNSTCSDVQQTSLDIEAFRGQAAVLLRQNEIGLQVFEAKQTHGQIQYTIVFPAHFLTSSLSCPY